MEEKEREKIIVKTSVIGIVANVLLALVKAIVGIFSHSIAIILDAVNNLSDALSSVITIVGAKFASKPANKKHPFGHGRSEYLSALVISVIILYAGITSFVESVKKILEPQTPDYAPLSLIFVGIAVVVKIALGLFVKSRGKKSDSDALIASGQDALMDSIVSASTLVAALVFVFAHISLESYLGVLISILIIKSGLESLGETVGKILGERANAEFSHAIKRTVRESDPEIRGVFDLFINDFGPAKHVASVHIEVPDSWTANKIDSVTRKISANVFEKHHVAMAAVGIYSANTASEESANVRAKISEVLRTCEGILQIHGFFLDEKTKTVRFDLVVSFDVPNLHQAFDSAVNAVQNALPEYTIQAQLDTDISD